MSLQLINNTTRRTVSCNKRCYILCFCLLVVYRYTNCQERFRGTCAAGCTTRVFMTWLFVVMSLSYVSSFTRGGVVISAEYTGDVSSQGPAGNTLHDKSYTLCIQKTSVHEICVHLSLKPNIAVVVPSIT